MRSLDSGFVGLALRGSRSIFTLGALFASVMLPAAFAQTYSTFDPPGAVNTYPTGINSLGDVAGTYTDSFGASHGFLRTANGTITTFDAPGSFETVPYGINSSDEITGYAIADFTYEYEGFLRTSDGTITIVDIPGGAGETYPYSINSSGDIAGFAVLTSGSGVGFILTSGGTLTIFDASNYRIFINDTDDVAGTILDRDIRDVGFVKPNGGSVTTFKVPLELFTYVTGFNDSGTVAGYASDQVCGPNSCVGSSTYEGLVRTSDGKITLFQEAKEVATEATAINASGEITGSYATSQDHGFSRDPSGVMTTIDPPGSTGTFPTSINDSGTITGQFYMDGAYHGFILTP